MFALGRRKLLLAASALALGGCNNANSTAGVSAEDMALGAADAKVTLIEDASSTCSHCAASTTQTSTAAQPETACAGLAWPVAPAAINAACLWGSMSCTCTGQPWASRRAAMAPPILPTPTTAMG